MPLFLGIDPGMNGALAAINAKGKLIGVWDTPILEDKSKTKSRKTGMIKVHVDRAYLPTQMAVLLENLQQPVVVNGVLRVRRIVVVGLEQVHSMPKQSAQSGFSLGRGTGLWEGVIAALRLPLQTVSPIRWKKDILGKGTGNDKSISIARCQALFPQSVPYLTRKKDDGRAEAILIAEWMRRTNSHNPE